ncbi:hypothetical protein MNAN1_003362 [Malassezia nana]|uniref:G-patch domain-containing protein n=1 Tax=Malassezia nana TaxID=180528 RepID=A0AAF0ETX1_9BASI|nr:hypothetical protein MNAN1_003362 [Malassezia nana]
MAAEERSSESQDVERQGDPGWSEAYLRRDYDPNEPNDYVKFKSCVVLWRQQRPWEDDSDEDSGDDRPRLPQFAPPASYAPVLGDPDEQVQDEPKDKTLCMNPKAPPPGPPPVRPAFMARQEVVPTKPPPPGPPPVMPTVSRQRPLAPRFVRSHDQDAEPSPETCGPPSIPTVSSDHPLDAATFAERLMARYGYKQGEGLGAEGNKGITTPLVAVQAPGTKGLKRGTIVNHNKDQTQEESLARYGQPSEVIVLTGFPLSMSHEELRQTILDACSQHGFVHKILLYPNDRGEMQAFVQFTGMAGAYRAVRALEHQPWLGQGAKSSRYFPLSSFYAGHFVQLPEAKKGSSHRDSNTGPKVDQDR